MNDAISGNELGTKLLKSMGLGENVKWLEIRCDVDGPATITLCRLVTSEQGEVLADEIEKYNLIKEDHSTSVPVRWNKKPTQG